MIDIHQTERETARWIALQALWHGGGIFVSERVLLRTLESVPLHVSAHELRAVIQYLAGHGLVEVNEDHHGQLSAKITPSGTDCVEYNAACPEGIARPKKYWRG